MLSKCANPDCAAPFLYLHQGKLFRLDADSALNGHSAIDSKSKKSCRQVEFFWLCHGCAAKMTVRRAAGLGIIVEPLKRARAVAG
jgi:hypothetical protein